MANTTTSTAPLDSPDAHQRPSRGLARVAVVVAVGTVLVAAGALIGLRFARAGVLPGVTVDGVDVGGSTPEQLAARLRVLQTRKGSAEITAVRDDDRFTGTATELGYRLDADATAEQILYRGRQGNPLTALADHLRGFGGTIEVSPVELVEQDALDSWVGAAAEHLELAPTEGGVTFQGAKVKRVNPTPGATVDAAALEEQAREAALAGRSTELEAPGDAIEPQSTSDDVGELLALARTAVAAPVTFRRSGVGATLEPEQIGRILKSKVSKSSDDVELTLVADPEVLTTELGPETIEEFEQDPESASFEVDGGVVTLVRGNNGFAFDAGTAGRQLVDVATGTGQRTVALDGEITKAELTNGEAERLRIDEKVSEFTTYHACCESRVTNIHQIADIVDDVLIEPGETFSLNGYVGERTLEKGFVEAGAISDGVFIEDVGGGVSQFTTTTYNAAFFGGYEIVEHKAHSYFISRYPEGREATLDYPSVDLKIKNNSPYGMVLDTDYTDESVTVRVYGTKWVKVETQTLPRTNFTEPTTVYRENDELPEGKQKVIQEAGAGGFDVVVTRTLTFPDGTVKEEEIRTTYLAQPRVIERNT